jgi:hypothetical protein
MGFTIDQLVLFFLIQAALYGVPLALLILGLVRLRRNWLFGLAVIAAAVSPFAYYGYLLHDRRVVAPAARQAEVASWPRKLVTPDNRPKIFVSFSWWVAKKVVAAGAFDQGYGRAGDNTWYLYERRPGAICPDPTDRPLYEADKLKDTPCVIASKIDGEPRVEATHLRLLHDREAPSHYRLPGGSIFADSVLELRWSSDAGGDLAAYWEKAYFEVPGFPPYLLGRKGFARDILSPDRYEPAPDPARFVLDAVGVQ